MVARQLGKLGKKHKIQSPWPGVPQSLLNCLCQNDVSCMITKFVASSLKLLLWNSTFVRIPQDMAVFSTLYIYIYIYHSYYDF